MDVEKIESKQNIKLYFLLVIISLVAIFLTLLFIIYPKLGSESPYLLLLTKNILETTFATILVTAGLSIFVLWIAPKKKKDSNMQVLEPREIRTYHKQSRISTKVWLYSGGSGRYTRDVTLPSLADICNDEQKNIKVYIQILNPDNTKICQSYAKYRNSLKGIGQTISVSNVQCDLLATIVAGYFWEQQQSNLNVEIYLKNHFSLFRTELSDDMVIITKENPFDLAILHNKESCFYKSHHTDLLNGFDQSKKLDMRKRLTSEGTTKTIANITTKDIKKLLTSLKIASDISELELECILEFVQNKTSPYYKGK